MGVIGYFKSIVFFAIFLSCGRIPVSQGLLYPFESETREVRSLDGVWSFLKSDPDKPTEGIDKQWFTGDLSAVGNPIPMPVPASYNDITQDASLRDHVGIVWYERKFFVPKSWDEDKFVWIRFGSIQYSAIVWINGAEVVKHSIGHLPFEAEISVHLKFGQKNRVTVLVDNVLTNETIPQGKVETIEGESGKIKYQSYSLDFFNYAGIHRSVHLYTTSKVAYIEKIELDTLVQETLGTLLLRTTLNSKANRDDFVVMARIFDAHGIVQSEAGELREDATMHVYHAKLWWPYLMHPTPGYLYTLELRVQARNTTTDLDVYRMKFGFRTISSTNTSLLVNGKPIYLRGFGRHEDSDIRGKGLDFALLTKDFNLLKWIGANVYRTSHYPYSEESMQFADENGILIIDECPSGDTEFFTDVLLENHKSSLEQLINRDRNHPSVLMWSVTNEPRSADERSGPYFKEIVNFVKTLDPKRPVTAALHISYHKDHVAQHLDIISINCYYGWYALPGKLDAVTTRVVNYATGMYKKHLKPVLMAEYGADTLEGLHFSPAYIWSEEYQNEILSRHFKAFDILRKKDFFLGEFVWNFADFKTTQGHTRVGGNKKGVFTRARQPKDGAHLLRKRYYALAHTLDGAGMPSDLEYYVSDKYSHE